MVSRTTLADALIEAGLEAEAAQRAARIIEDGQSAGRRPIGYPKERPNRGWDLGFMIPLGLAILGFAGTFAALGYIAARLSGA